MPDASAPQRTDDPADVATLAAADLADALDVLGSTINAIAAADLSSDAAVQLSSLRHHALAALASGGRASTPAVVVDAEDELIDALACAGIVPGRQIAAPLAAGGLDGTFVERVVEAVGPATDPGLRWIAASLETAAVVTQLSEAVRRISGLVDLVPVDLPATDAADDGPGARVAPKAASSGPAPRPRTWATGSGSPSAVARSSALLLHPIERFPLPLSRSLPLVGASRVLGARTTHDDQLRTGVVA